MVKVESISDENGCNGQGDTDTLNNWWWLAINGASCTASPVAMPPNLNVSPTPEQLMGFRTRQEQLSAQKLMLNAPISKVRRYMEKTIPPQGCKG